MNKVGNQRPLRTVIDMLDDLAGARDQRQHSPFDKSRLNRDTCEEKGRRDGKHQWLSYLTPFCRLL